MAYVMFEITYYFKNYFIEMLSAVMPWLVRQLALNSLDLSGQWTDRKHEINCS